MGVGTHQIFRFLIEIPAEMPMACSVLSSPLRRPASPKLIGRYQGETSDDIEVVTDDLIPLQRHAQGLAEIALGLATST